MGAETSSYAVSKLYDFRYLGLRYFSEDGVTRVFLPNDTQICGAKLGDTLKPEPCHGKPEANGRCFKHGGNAVRGSNSPLFKNGRYSKHLPVDLRQKYIESLEDVDLLSVRDDIALVDTRLASILDKLQKGESAEFWERLAKAWAELMAIRTDPLLLDQAINRVDAIIRRGANEQKAWSNIVELLGHRNKLVTSEREYVVEMGRTVPIEDVMLMIGVIQDILAQHVSDRKVLSAIQQDIRRFTDPDGSRVTPRETGRLPAATERTRPE